MKIKKSFKIALAIYIVAVIGYLSYLLYGYVVSVQDRNRLRELSALVDAAQATATTSPETATTESLISDPGNPSVPAETTLEPAPQVLPQYQALYKQNPDLVGWIRIEDSEVNYPVMYTPQDPNYYLYRDFEGKDSKHGLPFVDYRSSLMPRTTNVLLHAHNMKDGSMFATLGKYYTRAYYKSHPTVRFDTLYETGEYEIFAAFMSQVYPADAEEFMYYRFIQADTEAEFNDYVENALALSLYDTGIRPEFGDQLLTLSTCSYHVGDGRMVVVARKKASLEQGAAT